MFRIHLQVFNLHFYSSFYISFPLHLLPSDVFLTFLMSFIQFWGKRWHLIYHSDEVTLSSYNTSSHCFSNKNFTPNISCCTVMKWLYLFLSESHTFRRMSLRVIIPHLTWDLVKSLQELSCGSRTFDLIWFTPNISCCTLMKWLYRPTILHTLLFKFKILHLIFPVVQWWSDCIVL